MASLSALYKRLQSEAVGAPSSLLDLKILDAARQFMREVPAYQYEGHANIPVVAQTPTYTLVPPTDAEIVRPLAVDFLATGATSPRPLFPVAEAMLAPDYRTREGGLKHFTNPKLRELRLVPVPSVNVSGDLINIVLQCRPSRTAATIDDDVLDRWEEEIAIGALWLLYDMQDKPWTNKAEARRYKLRFTKSWRDATREIDKGFTKSSLRVKIPQL